MLGPRLFQTLGCHDLNAAKIAAQCQLLNIYFIRWQLASMGTCIWGDFSKTVDLEEYGEQLTTGIIPDDQFHGEDLA